VLHTLSHPRGDPNARATPGENLALQFQPHEIEKFDPGARNDSG
jgi:hypothetical protein